ncbi:DUF998 domain-containing protein [Nakamurella sp. GG22]
MSNIRRSTAGLLRCGVLAGPLFVLVAAAQVFTVEGFDIARQPLSLLSLGDTGWIQIANFIISGLLVLAFAVGLRRTLASGRGRALASGRGRALASGRGRTLASGRGRTWGPLLIGGYGAGLVVAGIFPPDPSQGFPAGAPAGNPDQLSTHSMLHGVGFALAFGCLVAACLVFARRFAASGESGWAVYCVVTAIASALLAGWPSQDGASIRYAIAAVAAWAFVTALAVRVRRIDTEHAGDVPARTASASRI